MNPSITTRNTGDLTDTQKGALATLGIGTFGTGILVGAIGMFFLSAILSKK